MSENELDAIVEKEPTTKTELMDQVQKIVKASEDNAGDVVDTGPTPMEDHTVESQRLKIVQMQDSIRNLYELNRSLATTLNSVQTSLRSLQTQITLLKR